MDGIKEKIKEAQKAGYKDDQIIQFLAQLPDVGPQVTAALESEYKPAEILKFLGQSPAYREGTELPTAFRGFVSAMQGPTFNTFPRIVGAVGAPFAALEQGIPLGEAYAQGRDIMRGAAESYEQEAPYKAAGGQLVASLPVVLGGLTSTAVRNIGGAALPAIERAAPSIAPSIQAAGRYMTAAPGANFFGATLLTRSLPCNVQGGMKWQDQRTSFTDAQAGTNLNPRLFQAGNFFKQFACGQDHTIADVALHASAHDAAGNEVQCRFDAIDDQGMARIVATLKAHHTLGTFSQPVD